MVSVSAPPVVQPPVILPPPFPTLAHQITCAVLDLLFPVPPPAVVVRLWDGTYWPAPPTTDPDATIVLTHPGALRQMFLPPTDLALGEAFLRGDFTVAGDLEAAFTLKEALDRTPPTPRTLSTVARLLRQLPEPGDGEDNAGRAGLRGIRHSRARDQEAIRSHYDVSNEFYALWLDQRMVYSCAYFPTGTESLDAAQEAKLDLICRKLRLTPGERLLDIGCGWGGLAIYAAKRYGVRVVGITLSERQATLARERVARAGLADRVEIRIQDYRDVRDAQPFEKIVSVGMVEHVGYDRLPQYFRAAYRLLAPGGLFLNHGIAALGASPHPAKRAMNRIIGDRTSFMQRYVFPDGDLVPLGGTLGIAEEIGWEVRDVEGLREHYARTLRWWVQRLEAAEDAATALVGPETYRIWRLYMSGSAYNFAHAGVSVFQSLLAKSDTAGHVAIPPTRADVYR